MAHAESEEGWSPQGPVVELSDKASWDLLKSRNFGHLGLCTAEGPDIFPVNYYSQADTILFRTATGSKLHELAANEQVAFEVDQETSESVWSVVARGPARVLVTDPILSEEARATFPAWVPVQPFVYVLIEPRTIRGRRFERHLPIITRR